MHKIIPVVVLCTLLLSLGCGKLSNSEHSGDYPVQAVPFTQIQLTDSFWAKRIAVNRTVTIPFGLQKCQDEGRIRNFAKAGGLMDGEYEGKMPFDDSDIYKIIEGISYSLQTNPDAKLDTYIDEIIALIAAAQEDDGYLCTWKTLNPDTTPATWVKPGPRWYDLRSSHELYNAGHMYEAAYAHFRATGKRNFLNIALKNADLIVKTFGPGKLMTPPGHQIIETGLVKLYRATGDIKYLDQAKFFLDQRGNASGHELYGAYNQDHQLVTEQTEAAGHAVRALYMYAGMADIAALLHDANYLGAVDQIWENVVTKKMYITGGLGARHQGEAFGENYELPNLTSYNETCAAIANVYWNHRMFLLHGESKYIDVLERTLYNGLISGVSLTGNTFFYPNCLASDGKFPFNQGALTRKSWFDCSCCPSNIIRFMPSVPDYIYAVREDTLYVNLFMANKADIKLNNGVMTVIQQTDYPWDGKITITVNPTKKVHNIINIRIPGWAQGQPLPGDLYHYLNAGNDQVSLSLNGKIIQPQITRGYARIEKDWQAGDIIELNLPMPVNRVIANDNIQDDRGKVALERGPIVYCAEWVDNGGKALDLALADNAVLATNYNPDLLNGVTVIRGEALNRAGKKHSLTAIPYYAWSHRGPGEMTVWLQRKQ